MMGDPSNGIAQRIIVATVQISGSGTPAAQ